MKNKIYTILTAALVVAAITVPASMSLYGNANFDSSLDVIKNTDTVNNALSLAESYEISVPINNYRELEIHSNELPVMSMDEANEMIQNAKADYDKNGGLCIDREKYSEKIKSGENLNSAENKSYIYHMMLNSTDYFNTAEGTMEYSFSQGEPVKVEFSTNIPEKYAYEKEYLPDGNTEELYVYDGYGYKFNNERSLYDKFVCSESGDFNMSDNARVIMLDEGNLLNINRKDVTNLATSGTSCLFPQQFAMSKMHNFDNWEIVSCEENIGRECAVIEGKIKDKKFRMSVDVNYGFLIDYEETSENGDVLYYIKTDSLENDIEVEKKVIME